MVIWNKKWVDHPFISLWYANKINVHSLRNFDNASAQTILVCVFFYKWGALKLNDAKINVK